MSTTIAAKREPRVPLSRERVMRAAVELADEAGIESLSMRKLAQQLGVEAMSLYHYVAKKEDILDGMLDAVYAEIELPPSGVEWRVALRRTAVSAYRVLLRHPWACGLIGSSASISRARLKWMDSVLGQLREAGFKPGLTDLAYHVLDSHIVGFVLWVLPYLAIEKNNPNFADEFLAEFPMAELPDLADHIAYHLAPERPGDINPFEFGLDLILDGLENLRATQKA